MPHGVRGQITAKTQSAGERPSGPLAWVPTAYLAEGIPFALTIWVAGTLFKDLGHSDTEITVATASIGIAWSLKPFWAAALDMWRTKKFFVLSMEWLMAGLLCAAALVMRIADISHFHALLPLLWLLAFASATQDICIDGIYITALDETEQAKFIGVQGMAWQTGRIFATALLVWIAGALQADSGLSATAAWSHTLLVGAACLALLALYHHRTLPAGALHERPASLRAAVLQFADTAKDFLRKPQLAGMLIFVFFFRSGEGLLLVEAPLYLQSSLEVGGAGLSLKAKGLVDGTISTLVSIVAGLLGGAFIARYGLRRTLFPMALCMNLPHVCYVYLSAATASGNPVSFLELATLVSIEKFGYSFASVANMLYMMQQIAPGRYPMAHYAFCTALMNLVLVPTQMVSGPLAEYLGYHGFFICVLVASIPSVIAARCAPFPRAST